MVEVKDGCLIPTKEEAKYTAQALAIIILGAYEGDKNPDDLIEDPTRIEENDYREIGLPWNEVEKAKNMITALVKLSK